VAIQATAAKGDELGLKPAIYVSPKPEYLFLPASTSRTGSHFSCAPSVRYRAGEGLPTSDRERREAIAAAGVAVA
jgi:hypothetical protein